MGRRGRSNDSGWRCFTKHEKPVAGLFQQIANFRAGHPLNPKGWEQALYGELIDGGRSR